MKEFDELVFDVAKCRAELSEFKVLLDGSITLSERKHVLPFFKGRRHLSALLGMANPNITRFDRIAFEFDIFGDFACDLAVGDSDTGQYCFVEFENAAPDSIFKKAGKKSTPEWSPGFDHGYSQIIDWFWRLDDMKKTEAFLRRFGRWVSGYVGLLIIGRDHGLDVAALERLKWRREHVLVNSRHIDIVTFDQLHKDLASKLRLYQLGTELDH